MPFKANAARRHHIPKQRYRVRNWQEYDAALQARGGLTVWFSDEAMERWRAGTRTTPGGQRTSSDLAILMALMLRAVYRLALLYEAEQKRQPGAGVVVPPRSTAVTSDTTQSAPTPRDRHLQTIVVGGRMAWQATSGYNVRALGEAFFNKHVIGDELRFQTDDRQQTEIGVAVLVLNRMLDLGRPDSIRIA